MSSETISSPLTGHPLIEARLESLDRLLLGHVPRAARLEAVRQTEAHIDSLLAAMPASALDREQILGILARVAPPESFLPTEFAGNPAERTRHDHNDTSPQEPLGPAKPISQLSLLACGLGAFSWIVLFSAPFFLYIIETFPVDDLVSSIIAGIFLTALVAVGLAAMGTSFLALWKLRRLRGTQTGYCWATAGLCLATIPLAIGGLASTWLLNQAVFNSTNPTAAAMAGAVGVPPGIAMGVDFDMEVISAEPVGGGRLLQAAGVNPPTTTRYVLVSQPGVPGAPAVPAGIAADAFVPPEPAPARLDSLAESSQGSNRIALLIPGADDPVRSLEFPIDPAVAIPAANHATADNGYAGRRADPLR